MYRVLIVDDEPIIRTGLEKMIDWNRYGCELCGCAEDGTEGLKIVREKRPDVIFTDIKMSEMDGLSMIREVKAIVPHCKMIILSGYRNFDYAREAVQLGAFDFLLKPSNIKQINETLERAIGELQQMKQNQLTVYREELLDGIGWGNKQMVEKCLDKICDFVMQPEFVLNAAAKEFFWDTIVAVNEIRVMELRAESKDSSFGEGDIGRSRELIQNCDNIEDFIDILRSVCYRWTGKINKTMSLKVKNIIDYIDEHYAEQISLYDVSESIGVSTYYASRIFKQEIGKNFVDYLNEVRMEKAKLFLKDVQYKVYEVADLVGIYDAHYFSKIFKKYVGVTPSEYRDMEIQSH